MENPLLDQYAQEVRYLLHRMDDAERERFGQRVVEDAETFDRVREAEKELYDAYARSTLPENLQADFRRVLLHSPSQQRRLEVARTLARRPPPRRRTTPIALLALAAGVLLGFAIVPRLLRNNGVPAVLRLSMNQTRAVAAIPEFQVDRGKTVEFRVSWNPAEPGNGFGASIERDGVRIWTGPATPANRELVVRVGPGVLTQQGLHELAVETQSGQPVGFAEFKLLGGAP